MCRKIQNQEEGKYFCTALYFLLCYTVLTDSVSLIKDQYYLKIFCRSDKISGLMVQLFKAAPACFVLSEALIQDNMPHLHTPLVKSLHSHFLL